MEYLYLRRSGGSFRGQWWPVAGTCKESELAVDTVLRELKEEAGLVPTKIYNLGFPIPHFDGKSKLEGYVVFVAPESVVELNYEHDAYVWLSMDGVLSKLPESVHPVIDHINENFVLKAPENENLLCSA